MDTLFSLLPYVLALVNVAPQVVQAIEKSRPVIDAVIKVAPQVIPILKGIAKALFPDMAEEKALEAVAVKLFAPHRMSFEEEKVWMDRQTENLRNL